MQIESNSESESVERLAAIALPAFSSNEWDDHLTAFSQLQQVSGFVKLRMGAVVDSLQSGYGKGSVVKFAIQVGENASTLRDYAAVYRRLARIPVEPRERLLRALREGDVFYSHVLRATPVEDDDRFIEFVMSSANEEWSTRRLAEEVHVYQQQALPVPEEPESMDVGWVEGEEEYASKHGLPELEASARTIGYSVVREFVSQATQRAEQLSLFDAKALTLEEKDALIEEILNLRQALMRIERPLWRREDGLE